MVGWIRPIVLFKPYSPVNKSPKQMVSCWAKTGKNGSLDASNGYFLGQLDTSKPTF